MPASDSDEDVRRQSDVALDGPLREREEYVLKAIAQRHGISRTVSLQPPNSAACHDVLAPRGWCMPNSDCLLRVANPNPGGRWWRCRQQSWGRPPR